MLQESAPGGARRRSGRGRRSHMSEGALDGKTAIVTGGGQGMGRAMALALARGGSRVAIADMDGEDLAGFAGEVRWAGKVTVFRTAVTYVSETESTVRAVHETY